MEADLRDLSDRWGMAAAWLHSASSPPPRPQPHTAPTNAPMHVRPSGAPLACKPNVNRKQIRVQVQTRARPQLHAHTHSHARCLVMQPVRPQRTALHYCTTRGPPKTMCMALLRTPRAPRTCFATPSLNPPAPATPARRLRRTLEFKTELERQVAQYKSMVTFLQAEVSSVTRERDALKANLQVGRGPPRHLEPPHSPTCPAPPACCLLVPQSTALSEACSAGPGARAAALSIAPQPPVGVEPVASQVSHAHTHARTCTRLSCPRAHTCTYTRAHARGNKHTLRAGRPSAGHGCARGAAELGLVRGTGGADHQREAHRDQERRGADGAAAGLALPAQGARGEQAGGRRGRGFWAVLGGLGGLGGGGGGGRSG